MSTSSIFFEQFTLQHKLYNSVENIPYTFITANRKTIAIKDEYDDTYQHTTYTVVDTDKVVTADLNVHPKNLVKILKTLERELNKPSDFMGNAEFETVLSKTELLELVEQALNVLTARYELTITSDDITKNNISMVALSDVSLLKGLMKQ
jgi:hypothetical protein